MPEWRKIVLFILLQLLVTTAVLTQPISQNYRLSSMEGWYGKFVESDGFAVEDADQSFLKDFSRTLDKISSKERLNNDRVIRKVFYQIQDKYLIDFQKDAQFAEISRDGTYNCLTATALYMMAFNYLDIKFNVLEKKDHIFLVVQGEHTIALETTDPIGGFIRNKHSVDAIIKSGDIVRFSLTSEEVLGLMYFNRAARSYINGDLNETIKSVELANQYYRGARMDVLRSFTSKKEQRFN